MCGEGTFHTASIFFCFRFGFVRPVVGEGPFVVCVVFRGAFDPPAVCASNGLHRSLSALACVRFAHLGTVFVFGGVDVRLQKCLDVRVLCGGPDDRVDVAMPRNCFVHLLLGNRTFAELERSVADCEARNDDAALLTEVLFPNMSFDSWLVG